VWEEQNLGAPPSDGPYLRLTPARHDTDGFFAAILLRRTDETPADRDAAHEDDQDAAPPAMTAETTAQAPSEAARE
jgi:16S rRNA (cytosine967-C5)-methyltransferase